MISEALVCCGTDDKAGLYTGFADAFLYFVCNVGAASPVCWRMVF